MLRQLAAEIFNRRELYNGLWLTVALVAIDLFYRVAQRPPRPWEIYTHRSAVLDYKFVLAQKLGIAFFLTPLLVSAALLGRWGANLLGVWLGPGPAWEAGTVPLLLFGLASLILLDAGHYVSHLLQHKVAFFWEFHKIHHAAEVLTPVTAYRVHPVEAILDSLLQAPLQALGLTAFYYLYGHEQSSFVMLQISAAFPLYYLVDSLRHSHMWVSFGPKWEHVLSSPAQHQIHHSTAPRHRDTNFARYFSFLDWMGGTLYVPQSVEILEFGLAEGPDAELRDVWSLYWVPLRRSFRLLLGRRGAAQSTLV